ncbi:aminoacyl-tRNA deacylase [Bacillus pumilus]|uniref:Prolyl-tRNA synthetase n=1 Tax=Bacillus pumilus (strain SAFR-032) TaxID=315750 RepID=A8FAU4_BACP2|nr:YbaK/EbsC family protein [Bacillus pumilus]ABV61361.1 prolyl-tRNA synthetase [Bacillus pumilus SAFR-032]MBC3643540.1 YbaK/EbsC family protein [Bacillus pumilus]MBC3646004.1 YbaK/EbsC family protein [Bacillus pumilus]MBC3650036.1 YbaK/EbsC family protein [Bacillus pumilus]MBC3654001.1 YbaK/EbsC family protein [Bacillus pumilus]
MKVLPAHEYLNQHSIPYEIKTFSSETEKGAANVAAALGFRERQMIKTLIFETGEGEQLLVMVGADQHIKSGKLKKAAGSRNIKMASPEKVLEVTGYRIGSIPPFCWQPEGFRTIIEASLLDEDILGVGAGEWGNEILITPEQLVKASKAVPYDIVQPAE